MPDWVIPMPGSGHRLTVRNMTREQARQRAKNWAAFWGYLGPIEPVEETDSGSDS